MSFSVVIPARFASTRLPGKPLLEIGGKPMLQHVWERASGSGASAVIIATDDARIAEHASAWGADVCMTRADHASGTDRLAEVAAIRALPSEAIVVNVQGDEPLIPPAVIDQVAGNLQDNPGVAMATLCEPLCSEAQLLDPNTVKLVHDQHGRALYFSRAPIPFPRDRQLAAPGESEGEPAPLPVGNWWRHIGLYAYRVGFLQQFVAWAPAPLEQLEQLEQLRALYHGQAIHVAPACASVPGGVDTVSDLQQVRALVERLPCGHHLD
jgi:3-deoxy-manno-octulosonate cytidylyltransferase (CMP-KDO synthetase)